MRNLLILYRKKGQSALLTIEEIIFMKKGDKAKVSPAVTGLEEWVEGEIIDVEKNPFKGIVIAIKDKLGRIFFGEEKYFLPA